MRFFSELRSDWPQKTQRTHKSEFGLSTLDPFSHRGTKITEFRSSEPLPTSVYPVPPCEKFRGVRSFNPRSSNLISHGGTEDTENTENWGLDPRTLSFEQTTLLRGLREPRERCPDGLSSDPQPSILSLTETQRTRSPILRNSSVLRVPRASVRNPPKVGISTKSRSTGRSRVSLVQEAVVAHLDSPQRPFMKLAGCVEGARDLSSRKGFDPERSGLTF